MGAILNPEVGWALGLIQWLRDVNRAPSSSHLCHLGCWLHLQAGDKTAAAFPNILVRCNHIQRKKDIDQFLALSQASEAPPAPSTVPPWLELGPMITPGQSLFTRRQPHFWSHLEQGWVPGQSGGSVRKEEGPGTRGWGGNHQGPVHRWFADHRLRNIV